jgi:hypothetical protein
MTDKTREIVRLKDTFTAFKIGHDTHVQLVVEIRKDPGMDVLLSEDVFSPKRVDLEIIYVNCPSGSQINRDAARAFEKYLDEWLPERDELKEEVPLLEKMVLACLLLPKQQKGGDEEEEGRRACLNPGESYYFD